VTAVRPGADLITTPTGVRLERLVTGAGEPVIVFAHGLGGDIAGTRPLGSGVAGRRVFYHHRGHGRSDAPPGPWSPADLAADLRAVADATGATRAVGVSLGAAALTRLLAASPSRFDRLVFVLPPPLAPSPPGGGRGRFRALLDAVEARDAARIAAELRQDVPAEFRDTASGEAYVRRRAAELLRDGLAPQLAQLPAEPVADPAALAAVTAPALVIGCLGDPVHPEAAARWLAGALPRATLHLYPGPDPIWRHRADLRARVSGFLNA
jgi:3-oxoadipate enol-lactonase